MIRKIARGERFEVSPGERSLALRRTEYLLNMTHRSLEDLIANAWIQGIADAAESARPARPSEPQPRAPQEANSIVWMNQK
jgi:hypothetical protein